MKFIGRNIELAALQQQFNLDSSFVVIYGRRRVGKTTLIKEFIKDKTAFYFLATQETEADSRKRLAGVIARRTGNQLLQNVTFSEWSDLFQVIADYRPDEKKVLVIDEFPYLVKTNSAFPSILQSIWDEQLKDANIMLILCGSLISMMKKHALSYDSPLYGRRTAQIRLMALDFPEVYKAQNLTFEEAVTRFSVTGGVPKYIELFQDNNDFFGQLDSVAFSKTGFLYEEPQFLLNEEVHSPVNYFSILKTIADGNHKPSKIGAILGMDSSTLSPYFTSLIEMGFLRKDVPVTENNPEKSRKGLYYISDSFMRFWFRYVYPFKGELELDNPRPVWDEIEKDFHSRFVAAAYESVCRSIFAQLCRSGELDFIPSRIGSYWRNDEHEDTEIDVAAVDTKNKRVFLGECKFQKDPVDYSVYRILKGKVMGNSELHSAFPNYDIQFGLFSKSGFAEDLLEKNQVDPNLLLIQENHIL